MFLSSSVTQLLAAKSSKRLKVEQVPGLYEIHTVCSFLDTLSTSKQLYFVHSHPLCSHFYWFRWLLIQHIFAWLFAILKQHFMYPRLASYLLCSGEWLWTCSALSFTSLNARILDLCTTSCLMWWGLSPGLHTFKASALPVGLHPQTSRHFLYWIPILPSHESIKMGF